MLQIFSQHTLFIKPTAAPKVELSISDKLQRFVHYRDTRVPVVLGASEAGQGMGTGVRYRGPLLATPDGELPGADVPAVDLSVVYGQPVPSLASIAGPGRAGTYVVGN